MATSSLSRAFTTRRAKLSGDLDNSKMPQRSNTTTRTAQSLRHQISAPVQLVHTTNMLSYNAPDLPRSARSNSTNSSFDDDDSDTLPHTAGSSPPTSPDVAPHEHLGVAPNHLSSYFVAPGKPFTAPAAAKLDAPAIPKRSPSHTKKNSYDAIARQRSISRMSKDSEHTISTKASSTFSRSSSTSTNASLGSRSSTSRAQKQSVPPLPSSMTMPAVPTTVSHPPRTQKESNPFGQELAQVTELAEEYGVKSQMRAMDEDEEYLQSRGLAFWSASDYLSEIQSLSASFFPESLNIKPAAPLWI